MLVVVAGASAALLAWAVQPAIGLSPDSVGYLAAAHAFATGHGLNVSSPAGAYTPITAVPPLFPALFGVVEWFGFDPRKTAALVNPMLLGTLVVATGALMRNAGGSRKAATLVAAGVGFSPSILAVYAAFWSEVLFLPLAVTALLLLGGASRSGERTREIAAALITALAVLTRYAGIALILSGITIVYVNACSNGSVHAVRRAVRFGVLSCGAVGVWAARNVWRGGSAVGRSVAFHPVSWRHFASLRVTLVDWLLPAHMPALLRAPLAGLEVVAIAVTCWMLARGARPRERGAAQRRAAGIFVAGYLGFLAISVSFVDFGTPFDFRILAPLYPVVLVLLVSSMPGSSSSHMRARVAAGVAAAVWIAAASQAALSWAHANRTGLWAGFAGPEWRESPLIAWVRALPSSTPLATNATEAVYALTGRTAWPLADARDPLAVRRLKDVLGAGHGAVAYFRAGSSDAEQADVAAEFRTAVVVTFSDGIGYRVD